MIKNRDLYKKCYFEFLAAIRLSAFIYEGREIFISDRPDLRIDNIGIEVCRGIDDYSGLENSFYNQYVNFENSVEEINSQMTKMKVNAKYKRYENPKYAVFSPELKDMEIVKKNVAKKIEDKIEKAKKYERVSRLELFIFIEDALVESELQEIIELTKVTNVYETIYFDCWNEIYVFKNGLSEKITFDLNMNQNTVLKAKGYARLLKEKNSLNTHIIDSVKYE